MSPSLASLPPEIFRLIMESIGAEHLNGSLASLARTCQSLFNIATDLLYHNADRRYPGLLFWAAHFARAGTVQKILQANPDTALDLFLVVSRCDGRDCLRGVQDHIGWANARRAFRFFYGTCSNDLASIDYWTDSLPPVVGGIDAITEYNVRLFGFGIGSSQAGASVRFLSATTDFGCSISLLHAAVLGGDDDLVRLLLPRLNFLNPPGLRTPVLSPPALHSGGNYAEPAAQGPLYLAICRGQLEIAKLLLSAGAMPFFDVVAPSDYNSGKKREEYPLSALHLAAQHGNLELVGFIVDNGYQTLLQPPSRDGLTPLWCAYIGGHWDVVDALLCRGADIDDDLGSGFTPLVHACLFGHHRKAMLLVDRGADVNATCTAYPHLETRGHRNSFLMATNLEQFLCGGRPLDLCCVRLAFSSGYDKFCRFGTSDSRIQLVRKLLDAGADFHPSPHSRLFIPPLVSAAANHLYDIMTCLLDRGAPVDEADRLGNTPLMALSNHGTQKCPFHDGPGTEPSRYPTASEAPLVRRRPTKSRCSSENLVACARLLIAHGADVNKANRDGQPPLGLIFVPVESLSGYIPSYFAQRAPESYLTSEERANLIQVLVANGADPRTPIFCRVNGPPPSLFGLIDVVEPAAPVASIVDYLLITEEYHLCKGLVDLGVEVSESALLRVWGRLWDAHFVLIDGVPFVHIMSGDLRIKLPRCPDILVCLMYYRQFEIAGELLKRIGKSRMTETPDPARPARFRCREAQPYSYRAPRWSWGAILLDVAVAMQAHSVAEILLSDFGVSPNGPDVMGRESPLSCAESHATISMLIQHGANPHIPGPSGSMVFPPGYRANPVIAAIRNGNKETVGQIMTSSTAEVGSGLSYVYIAEACLVHSLDMLKYLLRSSRLNPHARSEIDGNTHITNTILNLVRICTVPLTVMPRGGRYAGGETIRRLIVGEWIDVVAALAKEGLDPTIANHAGRTGLDLLGEIVNYRGHNMLKRCSSELIRKRIGGAATTDSADLDPAACFEVLAGDSGHDAVVTEEG